MTKKLPVVKKKWRTDEKGNFETSPLSKLTKEKFLDYKTKFHLMLKFRRGYRLTQRSVFFKIQELPPALSSFVVFVIIILPYSKSYFVIKQKSGFNSLKFFFNKNRALVERNRKYILGLCKKT